MFQQNKNQPMPQRYLKIAILALFLIVSLFIALSNHNTSIIYSEGNTIPTPTPAPTLVPPPSPTPLPETILSINDVSKLEGNSSTQMVFKITRSNNLSNVSVKVNTVNKQAFDGADFEKISNKTVSFSAGGALTKDVVVDLIPEEKVEGNEIFNVVLSSPTNALLDKSVGVGTILNDDFATVTLSVADAEKNEGDSGLTAVVLEATIDKEVSGAFELSYKTIDGTAQGGLDYESLEDVLKFSGAAGETKEIVVQIKGDVLVEGNETFSVALGEFTNTDKKDFLLTDGSPQEIVIIDDEAATLTLSGSAEKEEGDSGTVEYKFPVVLSEAIPGGFSIEYFTSDQTATVADADYVDNDGVLDFEGTAGEEKVITVIVNGDINAESNEIFTVSLGDVKGSGSLDNLTIVGNPQSGVILNDDGGVFFIDLGATGAVYSEFDAVAKIPVTFSGDDLTVETKIDFAVTAGTATDGEDFTAVSGTLTFAPGEKTQFIEVPILDDDIEEESETFVVTISNPTGFAIGNPATAEITIVDDEGSATISLASSIIQGDESADSIPVEIKLDRPLGFDTSVNVKTSDGSAKAGQDYTGIDETVVIAKGESSVIVNIPILPDTIYERNEDLTLVLSDPQNADLGQAEALVKIIEDEPVPTVLITNATQSEGVNGLVEMTFELELSSFAAVDIFIDFETVDGTAVAGEDYIANSGRLRIRAGSRKGTIGVFIYSDGISEDPETFTLKLTNSSEGTLDGTNGTIDVIGTIENSQSSIILLPFVIR